MNEQDRGFSLPQIPSDNSNLKTNPESQSSIHDINLDELLAGARNEQEQIDAKIALKKEKRKKIIKACIAAACVAAAGYYVYWFAVGQANEAVANAYELAEAGQYSEALDLLRPYYKRGQVKEEYTSLCIERAHLLTDTHRYEEALDLLEPFTLKGEALSDYAVIRAEFLTWKVNSRDYEPTYEEVIENINYLEENAAYIEDWEDVANSLKFLYCFNLSRADDLVLKDPVVIEPAIDMIIDIQDYGRAPEVTAKLLKARIWYEMVYQSGPDKITKEDSPSFEYFTNNEFNFYKAVGFINQGDLGKAEEILKNVPDDVLQAKELKKNIQSAKSYAGDWLVTRVPPFWENNPSTKILGLTVSFSLSFDMKFLLHTENNFELPGVSYKTYYFGNTYNVSLKENGDIVATCELNSGPHNLYFRNGNELLVDGTSKDDCAAIGEKL